MHIPVDAEFGDASFLREIGRSLSDGVTHVDHVASAARGTIRACFVSYESEPKIPLLPGLVSFVVPIKEIRQVDFAFFMPTQSPLWTTKPARLVSNWFMRMRAEFSYHSFLNSYPRYLSHIFGHEGEGSLLSALKAQGLATGLSAGAVYDTAGLSVFK